MAKTEPPTTGKSLPRYQAGIAMSRHSSIPGTFFFIKFISFLLLPAGQALSLFYSNISKAGRKAQNHIKFVCFYRFSMGKKNKKVRLTEKMPAFLSGRAKRQECQPYGSGKNDPKARHVFLAAAFTRKDKNSTRPCAVLRPSSASGWTARIGLNSRKAVYFLCARQISLNFWNRMVVSGPSKGSGRSPRIRSGCHWTA